ncbi:MAG: putative UDP-N-acetylmuramoyl-tripeptide:D-alanyl-D-alanine ligase, partial [Actinomycetota bacterium]
MSFDSRHLLSGQAFVAVRSDSGDGHDHLAAAASAGAPWALVERGLSHPALPCVEVDDTLVALGQIASHCRERLDASCGTRIVGITGSAGKTTTKDLVHAVLARGYPGAEASANSLNNDIGLPVTLANADEKCPALVVEMGMRGFGEIARLCRLARPSIAVVTIVGDAHSERVGGIEGVARAKSEIVEGLAPGGTAILNADDARVIAMASLHSGRTVSYGASASADVRFAVESRDSFGRARVSFAHGGALSATQVPFPGDHMASNAAAAVAVGLACGMAL